MVSGLLVSLFSIATGAMEKNQRLKDEINRLKGEDGKAQVKANKRGAFSSEKERKAAEEGVSSVAQKIGFKLTKEKLAALGEKRIPSQPVSSEIKMLESEFDKLFSTRTGYRQLDDRIEKIKSKKELDSHKFILSNHPRKSSVFGLFLFAPNKMRYQIFPESVEI